MFLWLYPQLGHCQQTDTIRFKTERLFLMESGIATASLVGLSTTWYNGQKSAFHAFNDADEWLQLDKMGHAVTSYQILRINSQLLNWSGMEERKAVNRSLILGLSYMSLIEVLDGFSPKYGASFSDLGANVAGFGLYYLQYRTKTSDYFSLKYSFKSSRLAVLRPGLLGSNDPERWLKDYNGQTYWLSLGLQKITGISTIPHWLNLAIGYGGNGLLGGKSNPVYNEKGEYLPQMKREREYFFSLDVNTEKLIGKTIWLNRSFRLVSFLKLPLPGIKYSAGVWKGQWVAGW